MTLEELLEIDSRRFYRVMFYCSQYGPNFDSREDAEAYAEKIKNKYYEDGLIFTGLLVTVEELSGWQEEINEDNGVEYIEAAMTVIKKLREDLSISQELVRELLEQIVETEDRYIT